MSDDDKAAQKHAADQDAAGVDLADAESAADHWLAVALRKLADDPRALLAAHLKIENELIELRDSGIMIGSFTGGLPANGLTIRYPDGTPSDIIRMGTRDAVRLALQAVADDLNRRADGLPPEGV